MSQIDQLRLWLAVKLDRERDLLVILEKAAAAFDAYEMTQHYCESPESMDALHEAMGQLGYALEDYAAKNKVAAPPPARTAAEEGRATT